MLTSIANGVGVQQYERGRKRKKNEKAPEIIVHDGNVYVELDAIRKHVKKVAKNAIKHYEDTFNRQTKEMIEAGEDLDIRGDRKICKHNIKNMKILANHIDGFFKYAKENTIVEFEKEQP